MRDRGCTADEALDALVGLSNDAHLELRDVAQRLVDEVGADVSAVFERRA